ncbi:predicted protein [Histoplasma capsulatum G186AR]|uniref:Uncharacterized protein n=1 Tax=Ajellomyces capsulatus (strain G186AR / H82 / ATCC MYA-2454 / RMSCC 2432) TaxID=447093 RepID=C0NV65_AJECG|nr:uncharacterized protein HCBG_06829 [Histoplasma capsulatum G186AR]EEH04877.1 predicted protein [Histoplasma capsulatum G186AR]
MRGGGGAVFMWLGEGSSGVGVVGEVEVRQKRSEVQSRKGREMNNLMSPPTVRQLDDNNNNGSMLRCVGCVAMKKVDVTKVSSTSTLTNAPDDVIRESCDNIKRRDSARKPRQRKWFSAGSKAATRVDETATRSQDRKVARSQAEN